MKRRELSKEERELWQQEVAGKKPSVKNPVPKAAVGSELKQKAISAKITPSQSLSAKEKKRIADTIEAIIDLHGLSEAAAHARLARFIAVAVQQRKRRLLVITGKGGGVLKTAVPQWLDAPALRQHIAALATAPREKGGEGALLVLLKKPL